MKKLLFTFFILLIFSCKEKESASTAIKNPSKSSSIKYATGFEIEKLDTGITLIKITSPWPNADSDFTYALVPRTISKKIDINKNEYDAIITVPVSRIVATSTTHISALEALGLEEALIAFPDTKYISSKKIRTRVDSGAIKEVGNNESLNTEMTIELQPDLVVGFSISSQNKTYETLERSNIPVVYNGDWTEETPLGKAEWIKFFGAFFQKENKANQVFNTIESSYLEAKKLAKTAQKKPTIMSGALYKDVWYTPGGKSWAAQFFKDANADYLWANTKETGSLSLSWEAVLEAGQYSDFWIAPAQFTSYKNLEKASQHYKQFDAYQNRKAFTFAKTKGTTGGVLYYELAPQRPDIVLKDLIHILHPEILPNHKPFFFKPLD